MRHSEAWHSLCVTPSSNVEITTREAIYALDYIHSTARVVGLGVCQRLRYWRLHSPASGDRRGCTAHSVDPRTKINLTKRQLELLCV